MTNLEATILLSASNDITRALQSDKDPIATAKTIREQIRAAWHAALDRAGVPEDAQRTLRFPL